MQDVERVRAAWEALQDEGVVLTTDDYIRAAMRETLLIAAEAILDRGECWATGPQFADWLKGRADEQ